MKTPHVVIGGVVLAALAACGGPGSAIQARSHSASPRPTYSAPPVPTGAVMVDLVDYAIEPATLETPKGHVVFYVTNKGKTPHNYSIRGTGARVLLGTPNLSQGQSAVLTAELPKATYQYLCTQPGHESLGMLGALTVGG